MFRIVAQLLSPGQQKHAAFDLDRPRKRAVSTTGVLA
jgi:hypothetical protein